ncbi:MAG TPA: diguanylate cyclase, partial [Burkholderiaceae bacterium]
MTLPAFLNVNRLEGRIVAVFLGLLLAVQLISFGVIRNAITRNAERAIESELKTGERVFRRLLVQQAEKRADAAALLAQDYGFKQAVGLPLAEAGTRETIQDALANQGERIGATVVAYFDNDLKLVAATRADAGRFGTLLRGKLEPAKADDVQLALIDGQAFQVVAQPVRTPAPVGWILMGFALDGAALADLKELSDLQGVVVRRDGESAPWKPLVFSLEAPQAAQVATEIPADGLLFPTEIGNEEWRGHLATLGKAEPRLGVVLLRSFDAAVAPFNKLQLVLLALTLVGVAVFAFLSVLLARRISGPLKALSESAQRLGGGDYETPVAHGGAAQVGEVGDLADAFEAMREGIRTQTAKVDRLAYWDELTELPNRAQFIRKLEARVHERKPCAVLMLDLDRFKHVNDILGHEFGDTLLKGVALRLRLLCTSRNAELARLAGDEFALLLDQAEESVAKQVAHDILLDFRQPLTIDRHTIDLGAGIGIALYPQHGADVEQLLSRVELAMYAAKAKQCGSLVYHAALDAGSQESLSLMSDLRQAVGDNELRLYLQPKVDLKTGDVIGAEALVRWQHPTRGLVPPLLFIPFAEQTGFINTLTSWVVA